MTSSLAPTYEPDSDGTHGVGISRALFQRRFCIMLMGQ